MAESFHTNLPNVATAFINQLGIRVTGSSLKEKLTENPFFPSLYSLSNTFEKFNIAHEAFRLDKDNIDKLATPFIAYLANQPTGKDFVAVTSISPKEVTLVAENKKSKKVTREALLKNWLGIVLQAQPDENSGEKDYAVKRKAEIKKANKKKALVAGACGVLVATFYFFLAQFAPSKISGVSVLLFIKLTGLATTVLLLTYEIDKSNSFVKNICSAGKQANCEAVLGSRGSKIMGMSWSEAGFFYFAGTFLFLLFPGLDLIRKISVLSAANLLAAPYILFSIYYQWKIVKQWCPLCLTVQAVLAMELVWGIINYWQHPFTFSLRPLAFSFLAIAWCLALPIIVWYSLKAVIVSAKEAATYKAAYKRLLYNPDTFQNLLQQQQAAPDGYQNLGITLGNPAAENTIIKVCNPYCGPCAKAHPVLDEIIHNNKNVKLKLIFAASNDKDDQRGTAARHLLAISKKNPEQTERALDDWYGVKKKDYEQFAEKYPLNGEVKEQENEIEKMRAWCKEAEIAFTPTIYINGHRLPEKYKIEELKYIL